MTSEPMRTSRVREYSSADTYGGFIEFVSDGVY